MPPMQEPFGRNRITLTHKVKLSFPRLKESHRGATGFFIRFGLAQVGIRIVLSPSFPLLNRMRSVVVPMVENKVGIRNAPSTASQRRRRWKNLSYMKKSQAS